MRLVSIMPGATELTRMPLGPSSPASTVLSASIAAFDVA